MYCTNCGAKSEEGATFCSYCGTVLDNSQNNNNVVSKDDITQNNVFTSNTLDYNNVNSNAEDFNKKYANWAFWTSLVLAIISLIFRIGYIWVTLLCIMLFNWIKKGKQSSLVKKAKMAKIFTIIFIALQVINYIYFFYTLG